MFFFLTEPKGIAENCTGMVFTNHLSTNVKISLLVLRLSTRGIRSNILLKTCTDISSDNSNKREGRHLFNKPVFMYAKNFRNRVAIRDNNGEHNYENILDESIKVGQRISEITERDKQQRIAFLCPNDVTYITTQWGCWISGHTAVPLSRHYPLDMMEYIVNDCAASLLITTKEHEALMQLLTSRTGKKLIILDEVYRCTTKECSGQTTDGCVATTRDINFDPSVYKDGDAMILYTSGSTGNPKGVVLSHSNLIAQINSQVEAWEWQARDVLLHVLPLHHIHGVVNALMCPLSVGAKLVMLPTFNSEKVWNCFLSRADSSNEHVNIFMGVPTMYVKLIHEYERTLTKTQRMVEFVKAVCSTKIRLMVSGSAPLPEEVFRKWQMITGHEIVERYGMTEIGMALSNPVRGIIKPGFVGIPMPGVEVRIVKNDLSNSSILVQGTSNGTTVFSRNTDTAGELQVKGPAVFIKYWGQTEATRRQFTNDGWFKTGDIAEYCNDSYRILGRSSVDIIKTGGYKVSALQIESVLLENPDIVDVAIVGLSDITWGQKIAAVVQLKENSMLDLRSIQRWVKTKLPAYNMPTVLKIVPVIPRNSLGKINKIDLVSNLFDKKYK